MHTFLTERFGAEFPALAASLLTMRERDLKLKSDGDAFKSIFDDVLKTRVIGDVGRGIGACLGARGGLKGAVGAGVARWHEDLADRHEALSVAEEQRRSHAEASTALVVAEREHDTAVARVEELERLSAELQAVHGYRSATAAAAAEQAAA